MASSDKFAAMLGFAKRARKVVIGYDNIKTAKHLCLIAVSDTSSDNLMSGMETLAAKRELPLVYAQSLESIAGNNIKALGITDANMAREMLEYVRSGAQNYKINR